MATTPALGMFPNTVTVGEVFEDFVYVHIAHAETVGYVVIVRFGVIRSGKSGKVAVGGAVDKRFRVEDLAARPALGDDSPDPGTVHNRAGQKGVHANVNTSFDQHLERHELI